MKIEPLDIESPFDLFVKSFEAEFSDLGLKSEKSHYRLEVSAQNLRNTLALLKNKFEFLFLIDFFYEQSSHCFFYLLKNLDFNLNIIVAVKAQMNMPSMKKVFCGVVWAEKFYIEHFGFEFKGHVYRRLDQEKRFYDLNIYPEFDYTKKHRINAKEITFERFSPLFTNFYGQLALDLEVKDSLVTRAKFHLNPKCNNLFYSSFSGSHRDFLHYLEKSRPMAFFESLILFYKALEEAHDTPVYQELQLHRMIFLELERIKFIFHQIFLFFNAENSSAEKLLVSELIQSLNISLLQPAIKSLFEGSNQFILGAEFNDEVSKQVKKALDLAQRLKSKIRFDSIISKDEPYKFLEAGISGQVIRSFGIDFDQRQRQKCFLYDKVEAKSNLSTSAWTQDLYLLKIADLEESCRIIKYLLKGLSPVAHAFTVFSDVMAANPSPSSHLYYAELEGPAGLSSIVFRLGADGEISNLRFRSEVLFQLQKFEFIDFPEPKEQFFKKIYSVPLFLLES